MVVKEVTPEFIAGNGGCVYKVSEELESPIDVMLRPPATYVADFLFGLGITPNVVTIFRLILCGIALSFLWSGRTIMWAGLFLINYFFDVVDGIMARRYDMVTELGDKMDHYGDITIATLTLIILLGKYGLLQNSPALAITIILMMGVMIQTVVQQQQTECENVQGMLDNFKGLDTGMFPPWLVRWFSPATTVLWLSFVPAFLKCSGNKCI